VLAEPADVRTVEVFRLEATGEVRNTSEPAIAEHTTDSHGQTLAPRLERNGGRPQGRGCGCAHA
jgi:hypothetical protein